MEETVKRFDFWRLSEIVVQLATPIAVAAFAFAFNAWESDRNQRNKLEQERIARYALIPAFMDALTGQDLTKKDLAVRSVTAILGPDGETLLAGLGPKQIAQLPPEAQQIIADATNARIEALVKGLFSNDLYDRTSAYRDLVLSGPGSEKVIPFILQAGSDDPNNLNGITNGLSYLRTADAEGLAKWSPEVRAFLEQASTNGPNTRELANEVSAKLDQLGTQP